MIACARSVTGAAWIALVLSAAPPSGAATNVWTALGPAGADVHAVAVSPASGAKIVAGTPDGGFITTNGGASWTAVTTGYQTNAIAFDPTNPEIVYGATYGALVRSTDGGATYTPVLLESAENVVVDPTNAAVVWTAAQDHVYKSTDRGLHWSAVLSGAGHMFYKALAVTPSRTDTVWVASTFGGLQRTTDGGATWKVVPVSTFGVSAIAVHPASASTVLALGTNNVLRTTDGGASWSQVTNVFGSNGALVADPAAPGTFYAAGSDGVTSSADGGATWSKINSGLTNANVQALALDPADHTRLYAGTAGDGVFAMTVGSGGAPSIRVVSPNGGEQWTSGSVHPITWAASASIANVKLEYSTTSSWGPDDIVDPKLVAASVPNTGSYLWTVPNALSPVCKVKVSDAAGTTADVSDGYFTIGGACSTYLGPPFSQSFGADGGVGSVSVTTSGCSWTATAEASWIAITAGATGSGSGAISYAVAPNLAPAPRDGTIAAGGDTFTVSQAAGNAATQAALFVPIVLDASGVGGSHYTSELTLTNRSLSDASVGLAYTGASTLGGGSGSATITLPAGRQLVESDAIAYLARLGVGVPSSGNRGGTLRVTFSGVGSSSHVGATVRTTTAVANGQAGLAYGATPVWSASGAPVYLCGLRENAADRSNVALQNAGTSGEVTLRVTLFSGDSSTHVTLPDVTLPPGGFTQYSGVLGANGMANGWAEVERVGGSAPFFAYGVVNDQVNSDGSFVPPQPEAAGAPSALTVPVVVETAVYSSELTVTNWSTRSRTLTLTFVSDQVAGADHSASAALTIGAGAQTILPNVFQYLREHGAALPSGSSWAGALFVTPADGDLSGIVVGARTSAAGGGGRYGLFYPAVPAGSGWTTSAWLYGLQQNATNRTNLAIVNTGEAGGEDDVFDVDVYDGATGRLVHTESGLVLKAKRWMQVNTVLSVYAPGVTQGYACVRRTAGSNPFLTYAVINDGGAPQQRSDDGAFLAACE